LLQPKAECFTDHVLWVSIIPICSKLLKKQTKRQYMHTLLHATITVLILLCSLFKTILFFSPPVFNMIITYSSCLKIYITWSIRHAVKTLFSKNLIIFCFIFYYFDVFILKIIFKYLKNIILIHFRAKNVSKSNHYHVFKHPPTLLWLAVIYLVSL
jgi:hypothetical protein